ncbi:MAG: MFS transporter, partial [Oscillospiraceae bacterium]
MKTKIGIYGISLLMMGVIGVSGALSTIGGQFPDASQTMIQNIISIPCLVVIPVTLIVGRLMELFSKKLLATVGVLLFIVGGVLPMFLQSLPAILVLRGVLGIGVGIVQPVGSALIAENFDGAERERVQGNSTSAQMLGCAVMVFAGGWLATRVLVRSSTLSE